MNPSDEARWIGAAPTYIAQYMGAAGLQNPGNNSLLCDTGAVGGGWYDIFVVVTASNQLGVSNLDFQWRNAANSANVLDIPFFGYTELALSFELRNIKVGAGERFRFYITGGFTGIVGASIFAVRRA